MPSRIKTASVYVAATLAATATSQGNPTFLDWSAEISTIGGGVRVIRLLNLKTNKYLREAGAPSQPNLSLVANSTIVNVSFVTQSFGSAELSKTRAVLGQQMAIQVSKEYLFVEKTPKGSFLRTGTEPKFEWLAIGVGNVGTEPNSRMAIGLLNTRVRDFLVFQTKAGGGFPLGWDKDNKSAPYLRGRTFVQNLRKQGFNPMADLVKRVMGW